MRNRSIIVAGIFVLTLALLVVPLVLAGNGAVSISRNAGSVTADPVDSRPAQGAISLTHSLSQVVMGGNSVACSPDGGSTHTDNNYLRRFTLTDFGIAGNFDVTDVEIGIQTATAGAGGVQPATVKLYTWDPADPFIFANFTLIASADVTVPDSALTKIMYPIDVTVPAGSTLVAEFFTPSGTAAGNAFWVGSNNLGETDDSFFAAAPCGLPEPTPPSDIGFPDMMLVMNVWGDEVLVPDMTFDKTVGLDANSCATTDEITVPAGGGGTDVTYCYTLSNTGTTTLTYHTVDDDQLGTIIGPDFQADVGPGAGLYFTETANITETTVNVATWYISDGDGTVIISDTDTATVTQQAPTSVALSSIEFETTNWLIPVAFVAMLSVAGAAFVLRRKATA